MRRLLRFLKLADTLDKNKDAAGLQSLCVQFDAFLQKHGHYVPENDGSTPNPWRRNMDYAGWENSPYFGSIAEFMEKFPGGIRDWIEWRRETQTDRNKKWSEFSWEKKAEQRVRTAGKKRKAIYSAVFLTPDAKETLSNWWTATQGGLLPKQFMHHMTIKFKPSPEEVLSLPLGKDVQLKITGIGSDEKGQAVAVHSDLPVDNPIPHITVATDGTSPVYSNELLSAGLKPVEESPILSGVVGFFDGKGMRTDFAGTIYEGMGQQEPEPEPQPEPESEADESQVEYLGEEVTDEERDKAFDLIAKHIEMYKEHFGLTDEEIKKWLESKFGKMTTAHFVDTKEDKTKDFPKEKHLWSGDGPGSFKSVFDYIKQYRSQDAKDSDAFSKAVVDFINYWKLLKKIKRKKG
jgi:hypothetical protein